MFSNNRLENSPAGVDVARMGLKGQFHEISVQLTKSIAALDTLFTSNVREAVQPAVVYQR